MDAGDLLLIVAGTALVTTIAAFQLPDLGEPGTVPLIAAFFGFVSATAAKLNGASAHEVQRAAFEGGFYGTALGLLLYLVVGLADL